MELHGLSVNVAQFAARSLVTFDIHSSNPSKFTFHTFHVGKKKIKIKRKQATTSSVLNL